MIADLAAFAGVAAMINVTPGLDTVLVMRNAVTSGKAAGFAAGLGVITGCVIWGLATAAGITALLAASHAAFEALRIAGAAYLAWLGGSVLWQCWRRRSAGTAAAAPADEGPAPLVPAGQRSPQRRSPQRRGGAAAFATGLRTNLLNPKAGVFYVSLLPQFLPPRAPLFATTMLLTAVDVAELMIWFFVVSCSVSALGERIRRPSFQRRMEQLSGIVFLGFAAELVLERR